MAARRSDFPDQKVQRHHQPDRHANDEDLQARHRESDGVPGDWPLRPVELEGLVRVGSAGNDFGYGKMPA